MGIIEQIASALNAAHEVGLVHRDVKPSNILVAENDFAYLIDFGIARAAGETGLTSSGATIGTWAYMAPERFKTGTADARADVYALTCVLYQAVTGQLPFPGNSLEQVAAAHLFQSPPRPSTVQRGIRSEMDDVIATGGERPRPAVRHNQGLGACGTCGPDHTGANVQSVIASHRTGEAPYSSTSHY